MNQNYYLYYQEEDGDYRIYDNKQDCLYSSDRLPSKYFFYMIKGYEPTDEGLMKYAIDFNVWCTELYNEKIDYTGSYSHDSAIIRYFKYFSKNINFEKIGKTEMMWIEACNNGGLMYCEPQTCKSYAYDFSKNYPRILGSKRFRVPDKSGKEKIINELPDRVMYELGYFRVKITCENEQFRKVFAFSKDHTYTDISLNFALAYKRKYKVNIELINDGKPNAYIYDSYVSGSKIFSQWLYKLLPITEKYPKNELAKYLLSGLWGRLVAWNTRRVTWTDIEKEGLDVGPTCDSDYVIKDYKVYSNDGNEIYKIYDPHNAYRHNIRIKAFLTSYARNKVAYVALEHIKKVVRIQTDCVVFRKKYNFEGSTYNFLSYEEKSSGMIRWEHVNSYYTKCKCGVWYHNTERKEHKEHKDNANV